jgi:hypothetical protein
MRRRELLFALGPLAGVPRVLLALVARSSTAAELMSYYAFPLHLVAFYDEYVHQGLTRRAGDEAVDRSIRVGDSNDCQDREQHDVRYAIQLPLRPYRVFDFSQ